MARITIQLSRISQLMIAMTVAAGMIFVELLISGPDIDGRTPPLRDTIHVVAIECAIVLAFALSAVALFRWHQLGWWLSVVLDGFLGVAAIFLIFGDFNGRFMATQEGRDGFHGDLAIHGSILILCTGAIGFLLLVRKRFLTEKTTETL